MESTKYKIYRQPQDLPTDWNLLAKNNIFLSKEYLTALHQGLPNNIQLFFVAVRRNNKTIAIASYQKVSLQAGEMFRDRFGNSFADRLKAKAISPVKGNLLVLGNMLHTGEHAFIIDSKHLSKHDCYGILQKARKEICEICQKEKSNILILLEKDFFSKKFVQSKQNKNYKYHPFSVQPNMILSVRENWKSFADYLADMTTKYRTRYKRARKKLGNTATKELSLDEIKTHQNQLFQLYKNVSDNAGFNTFVLPENHFYQLKLNLKENFVLKALFSEDKKIIGFYTLINNKPTLEAYFLGYDAQLQTNMQLYLNMLYQMIDYGIQNQFKRIVFARTAMEIKSSVGAEPHEMFGLIKHRNCALQPFFKPLFGLIKPNNNWVKRNPFKVY